MGKTKIQGGKGSNKKLKFQKQKKLKKEKHLITKEMYEHLQREGGKGWF